MRRPVRMLLVVAAVLAISPFAPSHAAPTWVETATLTHAGGAAEDLFGGSVAVDGDVIVVGDPQGRVGVERAGSVHVFVRVFNGWKEVAELLPTDSAIGDRFGTSIAIHGDTIAVGAVDLSTRRGGIVYVFVRPSGGWSGTLNESARLDGSPGGENVLLGFSIAFAGDSIVSTSYVLKNQLFLFDKPASGWSGTVPPNGFPLCPLIGIGYLYNVAASGDVVVAGAPQEPVGHTEFAGKACVWVKPTGGWVGSVPNVAELVASDPIASGGFGLSVAADGSTLLVGSFTDYEKAYAFEQPSTGWAGRLTENAVLKGSDTQVGDGFGFRVSMSGGTAAIGAYNVTFANDGPQGALYMFDHPAGGWSGTVFEKAEFFGPPTFSGFGNAVAASTDVVVAGAPGEDVNGNVRQGTAHVYELRDDHHWISLTRFIIEGPVFVHPGDPVQFRVRVEGQQRATTAPQGVVIVSDEVGEVCRVLIDPAAGEGACELTFSSPGLYRVRGHYLGNADFGDSWTRTVPVHVDTRGGH